MRTRGWDFFSLYWFLCVAATEVALAIGSGSSAKRELLHNGYTLGHKWSTKTSFASIPVIPIQISALHRLGKMLGRDMVRMIQICNGSGNAQQTIMCPGGEIHPTNSHLECALTALIQRAQRS